MRWRGSRFRSGRGENVGPTKNETGPDVFSDRSPFHVQTKPEGILFISRYRKQKVNSFGAANRSLSKVASARSGVLLR